MDPRNVSYSFYHKLYCIIRNWDAIFFHNNRSAIRDWFVFNENLIDLFVVLKLFHVCNIKHLNIHSIPITQDIVALYIKIIKEMWCNKIIYGFWKSRLHFVHDAIFYHFQKHRKRWLSR
jgi:hypothetical protein